MIGNATNREALQSLAAWLVSMYCRLDTDADLGVITGPKGDDWPARESIEKAMNAWEKRIGTDEQTAYLEKLAAFQFAWENQIRWTATGEDTSNFNRAIEWKAGPKPTESETDATDRRFAEFHKANPRVYEWLCKRSLELKASGERKYGVKALFEELRWHAEFAIDGKAFQLDNRLTSIYARKLMQDVPILVGFFETRKRNKTT